MNNLRFVNEKPRSIPEQKRCLRESMKRRRSEIENRDVKEDLLVENTLKLLAEIYKSKGAGIKRSIFVYLSYSAEAKTDKLIELLQEKGYEVYAPKTNEKDMDAVIIGSDFSLSSLGIREPVGTAYHGEIDVAIVPLLAVDYQGNRLGYGKGYYDKFFTERNSMIKIGYCYDRQVIKAVPVNENDVKLDYIVTEKGITNCYDRQVIKAVPVDEKDVKLEYIVTEKRHN